MRRSAHLIFVLCGGRLSAQEAGLLLSDAVLPLVQSQFCTVPPETQNIPILSHCPSLLTCLSYFKQPKKLHNSPLLLHFLLGLLLMNRIFTNSSMSLLVHLLHLQQTHTPLLEHNTLFCMPLKVNCN